jgi:hypothetical protein
VESKLQPSASQILFRVASNLTPQWPSLALNTLDRFDLASKPRTSSSITCEAKENAQVTDMFSHPTSIGVTFLIV